MGSHKRPKEAEPILRKAVEELLVLVEEFPSFSRFRGSLLNGQKALSNNLRSQNKVAEAEAVLEQGRLQEERLARGAKESAKALAGDPPREFPRPPEADPVSLASAELSAGNYARAVQFAQEFAGLSSTDWQKLEAAAEVMAGALPLIQADNKLDAEAREKQAADCAAQAVEFLKQAIASGFTGMAHFNTLPCAKAIQARPDYQSLLTAPMTPPVRSPKRFTFDYSHDDPGPRRWVRDGVTWTETQPSRAQKRFHDHRSFRTGRSARKHPHPNEFPSGSLCPRFWLREEHFTSGCEDGRQVGALRRDAGRGVEFGAASGVP